MTRRAPVLALLLVVSCVGRDHATRPDALSQATLENAVYCAANAGRGPVQLSQGRWSLENEKGRQSVTLGDSRAYSDLDQDGDEDAVVVLVSWGGGSGVFSELAAITNEGGRPVHVASVQLGDRVRIDSLAVDGGVIAVQMVTHGEGDAQCCPTLHLQRRFRLRAGQLLESGG